MFFKTLFSGCLLAAAIVAQATPITPGSDAEVIETLPLRLGAGGGNTDERRLRRELAARPRDAALAVPLARRYIEEARELGDPRLAGQALAVLAPWPEPASAPDDVLLMQATVQQYLHDFDGAVARLDTLLTRNPRQPQAWLTLATVRRVQGRYADSDAACGQLLALRVEPHGSACRAENQALRGDFAAARRTLDALLAPPQLDAGTRNWLLTTRAELEERAGDAAAADAAYRTALAAQDDNYTATAYADFLIARRREAEALKLLGDRPRTDATLLRLAIAGARSGAPGARQDVAEMRDRIAQANLRPEAQQVHAREQSMFALWVDGDAARALVLARENVKHQREPIDLVVLAQAAQASRQAAARQELEHLQQETGLHDQRLLAAP